MDGISILCDSTDDIPLHCGGTGCIRPCMQPEHTVLYRGFRTDTNGI